MSEVYTSGSDSHQNGRIANAPSRPNQAIEILSRTGNVEHVWEQILCLAEYACWAQPAEDYDDYTVRTYEEVLDERDDVNGSLPFSTEFTIDHVTYGPIVHGSKAIALQEEIYASFDYFDDVTYEAGTLLLHDEIRLQKFTGGVKAMQVHLAIDGLAVALREDDAAFIRAVKWRPATEYDALQVGREIQRLQFLTEQ